MAFLFVGLITGIIILVILALLEEWRLLLLASGALAIFEVFGYLLVSKGPIAFGLSVWALLVMVPLILGFLKKVRIHWVILWELVMFSPILLIWLLSFLGRKSGYKKVRG